MTKHLLLALGGMIAFAGFVRAEAPTVEDAARAALRDGFPQAAIAPLEEALRKAAGADRATLGILLARAQLAAGQPAEALRALDQYADRGTPEVTLLRASALAARGNLEGAARLLEPHATRSSEAALLLARIRMEQGDTEAAEALLPKTGESLPSDPNTLRLLLDLQLSGKEPATAEQTIAAARESQSLPAPELDTALGRVRLAQGRPSEAAELFRGALAAGEIPAQVRDNARIGLARSLVALGVDNPARDALREGLAASPDSPATREFMDEWIRLQTKLGGDPVADLGVWAAEKGNRRAVEASLHLARLELGLKKPDAAIAIASELLGDGTITKDDALRARLVMAEALIAAGKTSEGLAILDALASAESAPASKYRLADLRGRALAATGEHRKAQASFAAAAAAARSDDEKSAALANELISALAADDLPTARAAYEELRRTAPANPDLVRWSFLIAAAEAEKGNIDGLTAFARRAPSVQYALQAKLALAEWRLARGESAAAERILRTAQDEAGAGERPSALAAAEIFAADNAGSRSREELVKACTDFLEQYPQAPEAPDIAFKLGELHSRAGDHAAAEAVLADLARSLKDAEAVALAKFLAAQAAARSMSSEATERAMAWFGEIAQGTTPLRHRARFEQASLFLRANRFEEALTLYDRILAADPPPEVRHAALMEKADTLFALGDTKPARYGEAAAAYAELAAREDVPPDWRDQAVCKRAAALARSGNTEAALAAYRKVLSQPPGEKADSYWFYKAGLEAVGLLEQQQDWPAAIAVYDQMAAAGGPQREELLQRSRRLRLQHFIWEN